MGGNRQFLWHFDADTYRLDLLGQLVNLIGTPKLGPNTIARSLLDLMNLVRGVDGASQLGAGGEDRFPRGTSARGSV